MSADADVGHDGNTVSSPVLGDTHNASAIAAGWLFLCRSFVFGLTPKTGVGATVETFADGKIGINQARFFPRTSAFCKSMKKANLRSP